MKVLIKQAKILDRNSSHFGQKRDILVENGKLVNIGININTNCDQVIEGDELIASTGFCDMRTFAREPGQEQMDTLESLMQSGILGGYTHLAIMPNTQPIIEHKADLQLFTQSSVDSICKMLPVAAVTKGTKGEDFNEMWDLHTHGAIAFSDGNHTLWNADIFLKSLLYLAPKGSLLIQKPEEPTLAMYGQMHEGLQSTTMGLKGIPSAAEVVMIQRDLTLLEYSGIKSSKPVLHFTCISSSEGLALIKKAKKAGLPISCDVSINNLLYTDEDVNGFDTNFKHSPPLRSSKDQKALIKGLEDGTIDAIVSDHQPWDEEHKKCEFDQAEPGTINLQTAFASLISYTSLAPELIVEKMSTSPLKLLGKQAMIEEGEKGNLNVFDLNGELNYSESNNASLSKNTPLMGKPLKGKIKYICNDGKSSTF